MIDQLAMKYEKEISGHLPFIEKKTTMAFSLELSVLWNIAKAKLSITATREVNNTLNQNWIVF